MGILETLRGKLGFQQEQLFTERKVVVDRLAQPAKEVLGNINTLYGNGKGKTTDLMEDLEGGSVHLGLKWETDKVEFLATPREFVGNRIIDGSHAIEPVVRVTWKQVDFRLKLNGTAELVAANGKAIKFNIKDKNWQKKIAPQVRDLITRSNACDQVHNEYYEDYQNRKRVERGEPAIDYTARVKFITEMRGLEGERTGKKSKPRGGTPSIFHDG